MLAVALVALASLLATPARPVLAAAFTVTSQLDEVDANPLDGVCATASGACTLRAAIQQANALAGPDTITLAAGVYTLTLAGPGEQAAATGDLDLASEITITGAGAARTIIQAGATPGTGVDRVFDARPGAIVTLSGLTIRHGTTTGGTFGEDNGAALWNQGNTTLTDSFITANQASATGGAIYNRGQLQVVRSTISGNTTTGDSGAIQSEHVGGATALTIVNSTISGNSAGASTGAILIVSPAETGSHTVAIYSSTIANNSAVVNAGGIAISDGAPVVTTVAIENSIFTGNSGAECDGGPLPTGAGNRIDDTSCGGAVGGLGAVTGFSADLARNGGAAPTHGLLPGSNALDQGVGGCADGTGPLAVDQRGQPRPRGVACDIGAFEGVVRLVTSTADSGAGSLRQAILDANGDPGLDVINFAIAGAGVQTIAPATDLPFITDPVSIDGLTQPGASCAAWPPTLRIEISGSGGALFGLSVDAPGDSALRGLLINDFGADGIYLESGNNTVQCNYIGVDADGTTARGNVQSGIMVNSSDDNLIGGVLPTERNLISANFEQLRVAASNRNVIQGNYLGTDAAGSGVVGSRPVGMLVSGADNLIGGTQGTTPGGACTGACNLIAGYTDRGIDFFSSGATGNRVEGNHLGVDVAGTPLLTNGVAIYGILFDSGANANLIGGSATGAGNVISGANAGITVIGATTTGNQVRGNRIFDNSGLGIDLGGDGATANDPFDADGGPNNTQNHPTLTAATIAGSLRVFFDFLTFDGSNVAYPLTIDFYEADSAVSGEGRIYLGSVTLPAGPGSGNFSLGSAAALGVAVGDPIVATATDANGNTSEFSPAVGATASSAFSVNSTGDGADTLIGDGVCETSTAGECTLRAAIQEANADANTNLIDFIIPGAGTQTISPTSALPGIIWPVTIDGTTQPGASCAAWPPTLRVELNGTGATTASGLALSLGSSGSTIRGLVINRFATGIQIANSSNNVVECNLIGTDPTGTIAQGNTSVGIEIQQASSSNRIGGPAASQRNLIGGSGFAGIALTNSTPPSDSNLIENNYIGTTVDGTAALGGTSAEGVYVFGTTNTTIRGNVISGNSSAAVEITGDAGSNAVGTRIQGNRIGIAAAGTAAVPNGAGLLFSLQGGVSGVRDSLIGSDGDGVNDAVEGNLIANNVGGGVILGGGTGNRMLGNLIYANGGGNVLLLFGANAAAPTTTVTTALPDYPTPGQSNVQGWLTGGAPSTQYTVQLFGGTACAAGGAAEARTLLATFAVTTAPDGTAPFTRTLAGALDPGTFVSAIATGLDGSSALALCAPVGPDNTAWYEAIPLTGPTDSASQPIALSEQVRWYYVELGPRSRLAVTLSNLPAGYDVALFNDLNARAEELVVAANADLDATVALAQTQIDYDTIEAGNFITNSLAPELYSPEAFTAAAFATTSFRPDVLADTVVSPFKVSPFKVSDLAGVVVDTGLLAYTEIEGTLPRTLTLNTFTESGRVYIAVYGRNGAFNPASTFTLTVAASGAACLSVLPPGPAFVGLPAEAGSFQSLFLTDLARLPGTAAERAGLTGLISPTLTLRPEVRGALVDLAADPRVVEANRIADANPGCPEAKNLVANEIKALVERYRTANPGLRYLTLIGGDEVIPYFRYADQALLGNESEFQPPVRNDSSAEAALRLGYILGQDEYGARFTVTFRSTSLAIPDLATGRLVETASEARTMVQRYLDTGGLITPPASATAAASFVSGYDFHYDSALTIAETLRAGTGAPVDSLLSPSTDTYQLPGTWTAADLRNALSARNYSLYYLAGHFSDGALKAADYATALRAAELEAAGAGFLAGALVVSPGCHSGYNTPDGSAISGATEQPDWAQFFARRGTALVAGTGYQYGDTQFTQFAEELYARYFEQLRVDAFPGDPRGNEVAIGDALVLAKQRYLIDSAVIRGIDKKTLTISTLFGLPMARVNMLGARLGPLPAPELPADLNPQPIVVNDPFALSVDTVTVTPSLTPVALPLNTLSDDAEVQATYVRGATADDVVARPGEPVLPLAQYSVGVAGEQVRGALYLSGTYTLLRDVLPLTGAPATELRGVHITFPTEAYYPEKWWGLNSFGELTGATGPGRNQLQLTPAQFLADPGSIRGTLRYYNGEQAFRVFYGGDAADLNGLDPALYGAPAIPVVRFTRDGAVVNFQVSANGGGLPLREVWVTFTADAGPLAGRWQSTLLQASSEDPSLYLGSLTMPEGTQGLSFFVQAANAAGFTALNTNLGRTYLAGGQVGGQVLAPPPPPVVLPAANAAVTALSLGLPAGATFGQEATFTAQLSAGGAGLDGQPLTLRVGSQTVAATTGAGGQASFTLPLLATGPLAVSVTYGGSAAYLPSSAEATLLVAKQQPSLSALLSSASVEAGTPVTVTATLSDSDGGIRDARIYLRINGQTVSARTGPEGQVRLPVPPLAVGDYPFSVTYLRIPADGGFTPESDPRYLEATTGGTLAVVAVSGPDTTITAGPSGTSADSVARFGFVATDGPATGFECSLRRAGEPAVFTACSSPVTYKGLANDVYEFAVRAHSAGGVDPTPATRSVTIRSLYRARQVEERIWIERNIALAGQGDFDGSPTDGWALVGRTNGAADNGQLRGFFVEHGVPYAIIFNTSRSKGNRCILVIPRSLELVRKGQTRLVHTVQDPVPCPSQTAFPQLP